MSGDPNQRMVSHVCIKGSGFNHPKGSYYFDTDDLSPVVCVCGGGDALFYFSLFYYFKMFLIYVLNWKQPRVIY